MKDGAGATLKLANQVPGYNGQYLLVDSLGYFWSFNVGNQPSSAIQQATLYFASTDCSGNAYVRSDGVGFARMPFKIASSTDTIWHVLPDAVTYSTQDLQSYSSFGSCNAVAFGPTTSMLLSDTVPGTAITAPTITYPLHAELP